MTALAAADRLPLVTTDLDELLRQVAQRDVDAFATFYDRTRARVFGMVTRVLRDPGYSEETTQDIYLQVWNSASSYDPAAGSPLAWLLTLAHRRAVDRVRSEQAASQRESRYGAANVDPPADHVAESVILRDERRQVTDCLDSLTDMQREAIQLAYYDGLTYTQVSERLSVVTVASTRSRRCAGGSAAVAADITAIVSRTARTSSAKARDTSDGAAASRRSISASSDSETACSAYGVAIAIRSGSSGSVMTAPGSCAARGWRRASAI